MNEKITKAVFPVAGLGTRFLPATKASPKEMLPIIDPDGRRTAAQAVCHAFGLIPVSLFPALLGVTGVVYFVGAVLLSVGFFIFAFRFSRVVSTERARQLFIASIVYLPVLLGLLVLDKVK